MRCLILIVLFPIFHTGCSDQATRPTKDNIEQKQSTELYSSSEQTFAGPCEDSGKIATCTICDHDGRLRVPHTDSECPAVDCGALTHRILIDDGPLQTCMKLDYEGRPQACLPSGKCAAAPNLDVCAVGKRAVELRVMNPCSQIVDCTDDAEPRVVQAEDGTPCDGGVCLVGQCIKEQPLEENTAITPSAQCDMFPASQFCDEREDGEMAFCEFRVQLDDFISCHDICTQHGSWCLDAWDDERNSCQKQERHGCSARALDQICRCAQPRLLTGDPFGP